MIDRRYPVRPGRYFPEWQTCYRHMYGPPDPKRRWLLDKVKAFIGIECQTDEDAEAALGLAEMCDMTLGDDEMLVGMHYKYLIEEQFAGIEFILGADALRRAKRTMH